MATVGVSPRVVVVQYSIVVPVNEQRKTPLTAATVLHVLENAFAKIRRTQHSVDLVYHISTV
jgi:hypothetical protein